MSHGIVQLAYIVATVLFIFALHWMNAPSTARRGVVAGVLAMGIAIAVTWAQPEVIHHGWIILAIVAGFVVGVPLARVPLTAVPQRTALSHAFGGLAAGLVGTAKYYLWLSEGPENLTPFRMIAIIAEIILGYLTFTGSLMAAGKLQEVKWIPQRPVIYPLQNVDLSRHHRDRGAVRGAADHPDRRRRHADGDRDSELLCGPLGGGDGVRAGQQAADHGGGPRRLERPDPRRHHVQGDEPVVRQRAVRCVRAGAAGQGRRRPEGLQVGDHRGRGAGHGAGQPGGDHPGLRHASSTIS